MSYRSLDVWQIARDLSVDIHKMTVSELPKMEMYEEGQQIRRSIKSVRSNIVEGYGRRRYKQDFIRFLTIAFAPAIETTDHLECLWETGSLPDQNVYDGLHSRLNELGKRLNKLIQSVDHGHQSMREPSLEYDGPSYGDFVDPTSNIQDLKSNIQHPTSDRDADHGDDGES